MVRSIDLAAILAHAQQQGLSRSAEGAAPPAGVLIARIAFPPLQHPLQRIVHDPPGLIELGYEVIGGVRWALKAVLVVSMAPRFR